MRFIVTSKRSDDLAVEWVMTHSGDHDEDRKFLSDYVKDGLLEYYPQIKPYLIDNQEEYNDKLITAYGGMPYGGFIIEVNDIEKFTKLCYDITYGIGGPFPSTCIVSMNNELLGKPIGMLTIY